jgi:hypothetical protein
MNARTLMFKQLQQFFEVHLAPRWRISDVSFVDPELAPKERGIRQRHREIVTGHFGDFMLSIYSTVEEPPLGKILCSHVRGETITGMIDDSTWGSIAAMIKRHERAVANGR